MNTMEYDKDVTKFTSLEEVAKIIPKNKEGKIFVMLTDYGKYRPEDLPEYDGTSVDGLRVAFHKKDRAAALEECKTIKSKGYKVFVSIVLLTYTVVINILYSYPTIRILTIIIAIVGAIFNYKKIMEITMKIIKK